MSHKFFCFSVVVVVFAVILSRKQAEGKAIVTVLTQGRIAPLPSKQQKKDVLQGSRKSTTKVEKSDRHKTLRILNQWIKKIRPTKVRDGNCSFFVS